MIKRDYSVNKTIKKQREETPIVVAEGDYLELYCNECNRKLMHIGKDHFICDSCGIEYVPESEMVKHGTGLETWDGPVDDKGKIDNDVRISELPEPDYTRKKGKPLRGAFKELEASGVHFTDYNSTERIEEDDEE